jgi:hypothetical protein
LEKEYGTFFANHLEAIMRLRRRALGMTFGITLGLWVFVATIWAVLAGAGNTLAILSTYCLGFTVTYGGAFLGLIWGIVYGFILGVLVASLYNTFCKILYKSPSTQSVK